MRFHRIQEFDLTGDKLGYMKLSAHIFENSLWGGSAGVGWFQEGEGKMFRFENTFLWVLNDELIYRKFACLCVPKLMNLEHQIISFWSFSEN